MGIILHVQNHRRIHEHTHTHTHINRRSKTLGGPWTRKSEWTPPPPPTNGIFGVHFDYGPTWPSGHLDIVHRLLRPYTYTHTSVHRDPFGCLYLFSYWYPYTVQVRCHGPGPDLGLGKMGNCPGTSTTSTYVLSPFYYSRVGWASTASLLKVA